MVGKVWSRAEEEMFWGVYIPKSPRAPRPADRTMTWAEIAGEMQQTLGQAARRTYQYPAIYEHYFGLCQKVAKLRTCPRSYGLKKAWEHLRSYETDREMPPVCRRNARHNATLKGRTLSAPAIRTGRGRNKKNTTTAANTHTVSTPPVALNKRARPRTSLPDGRRCEDRNARRATIATGLLQQGQVC